MTGRALALLAACALVMLVPELAEACPACTSKEPGGTARIAALGAMILLPFSIVFVVIKVLRRAGGEPTVEGNPSDDPHLSSQERKS